MGWLKSLFGNKKEIDTVYVELGKLSLWFEENLNYFTKTSSRSYYVLQEFFRDESGAIAQYIKKVDFLARSIFDNDYRKINAVSQKIEEIDSFLALRKKAGDLIEEEKTNYSSINAMKKETMDKMEKLEQSRDYRELQELGKEKDRISKEIRDNEAELISLFSPIEKSMKKYEKITIYGAGILRDYIDSPLHGLMKDDGL